MSRPSDIYTPGSLDKTTPPPALENDKVQKILLDVLEQWVTIMVSKAGREQEHKKAEEAIAEARSQLDIHFNKLNYEKACGCLHHIDSYEELNDMPQSYRDGFAQSRLFIFHNLNKAFNQEGTKEGEEQ